MSPKHLRPSTPTQRLRRSGPHRLADGVHRLFLPLALDIVVVRASSKHHRPPPAHGMGGAEAARYWRVLAGAGGTKFTKVIVCIRPGGY